MSTEESHSTATNSTSNNSGWVAALFCVPRTRCLPGETLCHGPGALDPARQQRYISMIYPGLLALPTTKGMPGRPRIPYIPGSHLCLFFYSRSPAPDTLPQCSSFPQLLCWRRVLQQWREGLFLGFFSLVRPVERATVRSL